MCFNRHPSGGPGKDIHKFSIHRLMTGRRWARAQRNVRYINDFFVTSMTLGTSIWYINVANFWYINDSQTSDAANLVQAICDSHLPDSSPTMSDMSRTCMEEAPARARHGTCRNAWGWVKTLLTVRLVLAVVPLFYILEGQWLELPIQCSWNVVCYYNVFQKVVVKSLGESALFPTSKCLMKHWQHAVKDTQARETNIISVCSLNFACWNDVCPNLTQVSWKTLPSFRSCLLYGPQNDHCGTESVPITVADVDSTCRMPSGSSPTTVEFKERLKMA